MLSRNVNANVISRPFLALGEDRVALYRGLFEQGLVRVLYHAEEGLIIYEAYYGDEDGHVCFTADGNATIGPSPLSAALGYFVMKTDLQPEEELRRIYGSDFDDLKRYVDLGPVKSKKIHEIRLRVDELAERLSNMNQAEDLRTARLEFIINGITRETYEIAIRVGFQKLYMNHKVSAFARDYFVGRMMKIQKEYVTLAPKSFPEPIEKALQYINNLSRDAAVEYSSLTMNTMQVANLLFLLQGQTIEFNGALANVIEPKDVVLTIGENGELGTDPDLRRPALHRAGKIGFRQNGPAIELYRFASAAVGEVFDFFEFAGDLDKEIMAEALSKRVLPLLKPNEVRIHPTYLERHPVLRPEIHYFVGLEENNNLSFKTEYYIGQEQVTPNAFIASSPNAEGLVNAFHDEVVRLGLKEEGQDNEDGAALRFLELDLNKLRNLCQIYISEELQNRKVTTAPNLSLNVSSGEDWFSMEMSSEGFTSEELLQLYGAFTRKKKFVLLKNTYIKLDSGIEQLQRISESFAPADFGVELPLYQALKLPSINGETNGKILELIKNVEGFEAIELPKMPKAIEANARPYQKQGIRFLLNLYQLRLSGILSDDMGLGKTLQSFGLFSAIKEQKPILVVCPKSLIYNWLEERNKWYPELPAFVLTGTPKERKALYQSMKEQKKKAVYFVSYDTLRNDIDDFKETEFGLVVLDEGQYIANAQAQKTHAVKALTADCRLVLTGTPVQNSLIDLWSIFDFLLPGYFPPMRQFRELYGTLSVNSEDARARLLSKIKPFLLGRKKKEVLSELPDKENITVSLAMADDQRGVYLSYLSRAREMLEEGQGKRMQMLAMMTRLRQICVSPSLFLEGDFASTKLDYLITSLLDLKSAGRKAIVFSSFVGALEEIKRRCKAVGLNPEEITGDTSARVRVILAERFNASDSAIDVMLVSLKAGGTGLNLIGADTVFHLDPWWNLAAERQAEDRAHRIGQVNKVTVFKLVIKGSIEEKVLALQEKKGMLIDLTDEASLSTVLTEEDYRFILS